MDFVNTVFVLIQIQAFGDPYIPGGRCLPRCRGLHDGKSTINTAQYGTLP